MTPAELSFSVSPVSSRAWISASVGKREPYPRSGRARRVASSLRERLVGDAFARRRTNKTIQSVQRVPLAVSIVEPKCELVDVSAKMLAAGVVVDAENAALHDSEYALDAVGGHVATHKLAATVVDGRVAEEQATDAVIGRCLIGMQRRANRNARMDRAVYCIHIDIGNRLGNRLAAALTHAEHGSLTDCAAPGVEFFSLMFIRLLAAEIGLVDFDDALQLREACGDDLAQAMQNEPRAFLGDAYFFAELNRANALACGDEQVHKEQLDRETTDVKAVGFSEPAEFPDCKLSDIEQMTYKTGTKH